MGDYIDEFVDSLSDEQVVDLLVRRYGARVKPRRYRPIYPESSIEHLTLGEQFIRSLEEEGDEEKVRKKYVDKGTRQPGAKKSEVEAYLERFLRKAQEEGRI